MWDRWLQRIEAVVERQQRVAPESDDNRLFLHGQHCRSCLPGTGRKIGNRGPLLPFGDGLLVDPVAACQCPQALLTMLYRSTDRLCRRGAPMKNLAHSASFDSEEHAAHRTNELKVERQQRVAPESDDNRLFLHGQHCQSCLPGTGRKQPRTASSIWRRSSG